MRILTTLICLLLLIRTAGAGTLTGTIADEKTGEPLIGAIVAVKDMSIGTATDVDGHFTITITPGTYTVIVNYMGYQTKEVEGVAVNDGTPAQVNILLSEASSTQLQEVVVRSSLKKENISALYVMQKNNFAVSSGISADLIKRSPDRNTGEVLKRVSGTSLQNGKYVIIRGLNERYNASMINGAQMAGTEPDKKAFSYDVIPSNLIDNIIINKTASADLPGDFAGGIVQVLTKDVPESNFTDVGVSLGYNTQTTFRRFISNEQLSANYLGFTGSGEGLPADFLSTTEYKYFTPGQKAAATRALGNKYQEVTSQAAPDASLQFATGRSTTLGTGRLGAVVGLVYRNGYQITPGLERNTWDAQGNFNSGSAETSYKTSSSLAALANIGYVAGRTKITLRNLFNTINDLTYYQREGSSLSSQQNFRLYSSIPDNRRIFSSQLEGDHAIGSRNVKLTWNLNYASMLARQLDLRTAYYGRNGSVVGYEVVPENEVSFELIDRNSRRFFTNLNDRSYGGNLNLSIPFQLFDQKQTVKLGYLGLMKDRVFSARTFQYELWNNLSSVKHQPVDRIFDAANVTADGYHLQELTSADDAYEASSMMNAGYVLLDHHFGDRFRLSWGARMESYTQNLYSYTRSGQLIDKTDVFNDILPSFNLSYNFSEETKLRLSGSRTVNRPEFRELAPFQFIDFQNNWTLIGNPDLVRAQISNLDLRYEYYPAPGEAITVGAFFKHFKDPIESRMDDQSNFDLLIFGYQNAPSAVSYGAELEVRKNLSFIADQEWLERLIVGANFTYIKSTVDLSAFGVKTDRPLQGQSPYLMNFSVLYNEVKTGIGFSALFNRVGERVFIVGKDDIPTIWEKGRSVIDLQLSKQLMKNKAEVKLTVSDLLNQPYIFYMNYDDKNAFDSDADRVFQKYTRGTGVSLGFTYRF